MFTMETDELSRYLEALAREDCYRVDAMLKESPYEATQRVFFVGANGAERGPYVRKLIRRDSGLGAAYERIFEAQQEGRRFKHLPTIVECYQREDFLVVVMEFVRGDTLQEVVYRRDPSVQLAAEVFPLLCDAVAELHESFDSPIIHRDLKPSNVILANGYLTLIDFGISRTHREGAESDTVKLGTRAFAPPEQFGFGQTTVRSDIYALGMLLYFCLTEKIPTSQVRETGYEAKGVPPCLRPILVRSTDLDPAGRYASAAELKAAFLEAVRHPDPATQDAPRPYPAQSAPPVAAAPLMAAASRHQRPKLGGWNTFVIAATAMLVWMCWSIVIIPTGSAANLSPLARVLGYGIAESSLFLTFGFAVLKKEPIRQRYSRLKGIEAWHGWLLFAVASLLALILIGIAVHAG